MTDPADVPTNDSVMIAFLPINSDWCNQDLPHMTLVYAGSKADLSASDFSALVKDAASIALITQPFSLNVAEVAVFGPIGDQVNVLRFRPTPELSVWRDMVSQWNKSEFAFNPHATIGPATDPPPQYPPSMVGFDRIMVAWGDEQLVWYLKPRY